MRERAVGVDESPTATAQPDCVVTGRCNGAVTWRSLSGMSARPFRDDNSVLSPMPAFAPEGESDRPYLFRSTTVLFHQLGLRLQRS